MKVNEKFTVKKNSGARVEWSAGKKYPGVKFFVEKRDDKWIFANDVSGEGEHIIAEFETFKAAVHDARGVVYRHWLSPYNCGCFLYPEGEDMICLTCQEAGYTPETVWWKLLE